MYVDARNRPRAGCLPWTNLIQIEYHDSRQGESPRRGALQKQEIADSTLPESAMIHYACPWFPS
jgi:hypothetical protein